MLWTLFVKKRHYLWRSVIVTSSICLNFVADRATIMQIALLEVEVYPSNVAICFPFVEGIFFCFKTWLVFLDVYSALNKDSKCGSDVGLLLMKFFLFKKKNHDPPERIPLCETSYITQKYNLSLIPIITTLSSKFMYHSHFCPLSN